MAGIPQGGEAARGREDASVQRDVVELERVDVRRTHLVDRRCWKRRRAVGMELPRGVVQGLVGAHDRAITQRVQRDERAAGGVDAKDGDGIDAPLDRHPADDPHVSRSRRHGPLREADDDLPSPTSSKSRLR
jgi:hypothetical protein